MVDSPYVVHHEGVEYFSLGPAELWREMTDLHRFEQWWSWLRDLRLEPDEVATGSSLTFTVVSPLPHRVKFEVDFTEVVPEELIRATVAGDLRGVASVELEAHDGGSKLTLTFDLEPTFTPLRVLVRVARPFIVWTKNWAISMALKAFRDHVGA